MATLDRRSALKLLALGVIAPGAALAACANGTTPEPAPVEPDQGGGTPEPEPAPVSYTIDNIRDYVVGVDEPIALEDGTEQPQICFDNAATTPALVPVLEEVQSRLLTYGSIGRGFSPKSDISTEVYYTTRDKVLEFLGTSSENYTCVYVNTATDGLNKLASALVESPDDIVLATRAEHHANDLPWRNRCKVVYAEVDEKGRIIYEDLERLLTENNVKIVTVTAASNVTGYVTDVHRVAKMAHEHGAKIVVDGAQIVAHRAFSMEGSAPEESIDYFVFSAHKMYTPFGGGAIVGRTEEIQAHAPRFWGGGTVLVVSDDWVEYKNAPELWEAGSPNYLSVVGLGKAIDVLREVGFDAIAEHEQRLNRKLIDGLVTQPNIIVYGDTEQIDDKVGVVTFNYSDVNTMVLALRLAASYGIATRRGAFCAHPYVWRLTGVTKEEIEGFANCTDVNTMGMVRVSFGIYNTEEEVDRFLEILPEAVERAKEDMKHYIRCDPQY